LKSKFKRSKSYQGELKAVENKIEKRSLILKENLIVKNIGNEIATIFKRSNSLSKIRQSPMNKNLFGSGVGTSMI
jgi:hypothetical protein